MHFGVAPPNYAAWYTPDAALEICSRTEKLGFDSMWFGDHVAIPRDQVDIFGNAYLDCLTTMAFVASHTQMRLGTHVLVVPYRHPVVTAKIVASLDVLSGGRVILGVGSGHVPGEAEALNTNYDERGPMTDEYLDVMRAMWSNDVVSFHGRWINFDELCPMSRPVQDPLPLVVGGSGRIAMRRAIRLGASWTPMAATPDNLRPLMADMASMAEAVNAPVPSTIVRVRLHLIQDGAPIRPKNPRHDIQRPRVTVGEAIEIVAGFADLGVSEMIIDVPPGQHVYLDQLAQVAEEVIPAALPRRPPVRH